MTIKQFVNVASGTFLEGRDLGLIRTSDDKFRFTGFKNSVVNAALKHASGSFWTPTTITDVYPEGHKFHRFFNLELDSKKILKAIFRVVK